MLRALVKLILFIVIVVALAAFFLGYRWGAPEAPAAARSEPAVETGTTGTVEASRERARDVGARVGETVAEGANAARDAVADGQVTARIKAKMALDERTSALAIDVDTNDGVVTLSGRVGSNAERQRATELARETEGVKSVVDQLRLR